MRGHLLNRCVSFASVQSILCWVLALSYLQGGHSLLSACWCVFVLAQSALRLEAVQLVGENVT